MPKTSVRAAAEGMPIEISDLLRRAMERHDAAYLYFESVCYLSDSVLLGRKPTEEEETIYDDASWARDAALNDVCYFRTTSSEEVAAKARYLRSYHSQKTGYLEEEHVENLLRSMLPEEEESQIVDTDEEGGGA